MGSVALATQGRDSPLGRKGITTVRILLPDPAIAAVDYELAPVAASDLARMIDRISLLLENTGSLAVPFITHGPPTVLRNHVLVFLHGAKLVIILEVPDMRLA
jgi:hypothetical protein